MKEMLSLVFKIVLLILAALSIIFGFFADTVNPQSQEMQFKSAQGKTEPDVGYVTPVYDPWTSVKVTVTSSAEVEVQLYASHYRGGTLSKDAANSTILRDEWLAAGKESERTGTDVVLKDFSRTAANYWVKVVEPGTSIPSDVEYTVHFKAKTIDLGLIGIGLILYAVFVMMGVLENLQSITAMLKAGVPMKGEEAGKEGLEALLEPTGQAPAGAAPAAPASYEALYGAPPPRTAAPARAPEPPAYAAPPPPPVYQPAPQYQVQQPSQQMYQQPAPQYQAPPPQAPAYQPPPPPPAYAAPPPPQYAQPMAPAPAPQAREPVSKVRCPACKSIVPIFTTERPTPIECPVCGKKGMIR
jgi:ABC-type cobalt transport system substrate-binding protein